MKSIVWFSSRLAFLCFLALAVTGSKSQDLAAAKILSLQGSVQINRPDAGGKSLSAVSLGPNDSVYTGDVIKTSSGGRVVLKLTDGSQAIISENTTVEIKDTKNSPRTIFNVLKGKTRIKIEKLGGQPNPYRVTTPTTVIAVRGTVFDVFVKGDETEVFVTEGEVSVTSLRTSAPPEVILQPGNFTQVKGNQPPQPPRIFIPQQNDRFFQPKDDRGAPGANNPDKNRGNQGTPGNSPNGEKSRPPTSGNPSNQPSNPPNTPPGNPKPSGGPPPGRKP